MYELLIWLTGVVAFGTAIIAYVATRDVFHPALFLGPMLAFSYWLAPLMLVQDGTMWWLLPRSEMAWVHGNFFVGVFVVCVGCLAAGLPRGRRVGFQAPSPAMRRQLRLAGIVLCTIGVLTYALLILNKGGLAEAYADPHGQGASSTGYVRESPFLIIPGLLLLMVANVGQKRRGSDLALIAGFSAPLVFHGLISASRGPTFMILITLGVGAYVVKNRRPPLLAAVGALSALAVLVLLLVTHRNQIYIGSDDFEFKGVDSIVDFVGEPGAGNEYIVGSASVIDTSIKGDYQYGARYFIQTVIRAIPRQVWPSQYEDTYRFFGIKGLSAEVMGDFSQTLGWVAARGASMGLLADVWKQLWWVGQILLFGLGWFHGYAWRRAVTVGGIWNIVLVLLLALSIYTTQQTFQAMLFRFMFLGGAGWIVWRLWVRNTWRRTKDEAQPEQPVARGLSNRPGTLRPRLRVRQSPSTLLRHVR